MKKIKITKIGIQEGGEESTYNEVGQTRIGFIENEPKINERFVIWNHNFQRFNGAWSTSVVTNIIDSNTFDTVYSKYQWEYID